MKEVQYQDWERALYDLPDDTFFYIMRNYLGAIQTPFHKPELIQRLTHFLSQEAIQNNMLSLMDLLDKKIITAVVLLQSPGFSEIYLLLKESYQYFQVQQAIINLEERLILFQSGKESSNSLNINPLFNDIILREVYNPILLFPSAELAQNNRKASKQLSVSGTFSRALLEAFLSFYSHKQIFVNQDGSIRKTLHTNYYQVFPFLHNKNAHTYITFMHNALLQMQIISIESGEIKINHAEAAKLESITWQYLLLEILSAGMQEFFTTSSKNIIRDFFIDIFMLFSNFQEVQYNDAFRLIVCAAARTHCDLFDIDNILELLRTLDILIESETHTYALHPALKKLLSTTLQSPGAPHESEKNTSVITIDTDYTAAVTEKDITSTTKRLYLIAEIERFDTHNIYRITKKSFLKAIDSGLKKETCIDILKQITQHPLPPTLVQSFQQWLEAFNRIQIYSGIVINADPSTSRILEKHPELQKYCIKKLAEGVYLFDADHEKQWRSILIAAGMDVLPETKATLELRNQEFPITTEQVEYSESSDLQKYKEPYLSLYVPACKPGEPLLNERTLGEIQTALKAELYSSLKKKKMSQSDIDEIEARIEKKLILSPHQLTTNYLHKTRQEANGFDYQGKLNLCKQAIVSGTDLLEIHRQPSIDDEIIELIRPAELTKDGSNHILIGKTVPADTYYEISIRKISLLRKLRSSLYTPLHTIK